MTRIAVLADIHADDYGQRRDPATGLNARFAEVLDIVSWIAQDARARGCDALVVAGDLTERKDAAASRASMIGERLDVFGGPTIVARGNHDKDVAGHSIVTAISRASGWYGFSRPGVVTVGDTAIAVLPYIDVHGIRASVPGMETTPPAAVYAALSDLAVGLARGLYVQAASMARRRVLVMHQGLSGATLNEEMQSDLLAESSMVVSTTALAGIGFDAVLAGHYHRHQVLHRDGLVVYAGSPHRVDHGEEAEAKGYLVVDTDDVEAFQFVETPARRFVTLRDHCAYDPDQVRDAIVRCVDVDPALDLVGLRRMLEADGAFDISSLQARRIEGPVINGGIAESLSPQQALEQYLADDPDRDALVERGRELIGAAS